MELLVVVVTFVHVPKLLEAVVVMVIPEMLEIWLDKAIVVAGLLVESTEATVLYPFRVATGWQRVINDLANDAWNVLLHQEGGWWLLYLCR